MSNPRPSAAVARQVLGSKGEGATPNGLFLKYLLRTNFGEPRTDEVRRTPLLGTPVNKGKKKGRTPAALAGDLSLPRRSTVRQYYRLLFTEVPGRRVLGSPYPEFCIFRSHSDGATVFPRSTH